MSNLDAKLRVEMREEILRIQRASKVTTVFVTHDQEEALSISDSVVVLKNGVFQQQATARTLYDEPENYFVADFLGTPPINKLFGTMKSGRFCFKDSDLCCELPLRHTRRKRARKRFWPFARRVSFFRRRGKSCPASLPSAIR